MMLKTHNDNMSRELRDLEKSRAAALEAATRADRERADLVCPLLGGSRWRDLASCNRGGSVPINSQPNPSTSHDVRTGETVYRT